MAQKSLLTNHELNRILEIFFGQLEKPALTQNLKLLNPEQRASISRGRLFAQQLKSQILNSTDSDVTISSLGSIQAGLQNAINELGTFIGNANPGHVDNYSSHLDGAIAQAGSAFFVRRVKGDRRYGEAIESVEVAATNAITSIEDQQSNFTSRLDEVNSKLDVKLAASDILTEKSNLKLDQIDQAVDGLEQRFTSLSSSQQREISEVLDDQREQFKAHLLNSTENANAEILKLVALENKAKSIVQIIGNIGVTGNYQNRAETERTQANLWRTITLGLFTIGIILVIVNLILNFKGQIDINLLLVRFAIAVSIALPAIYTARESARHRSNSDRAKQTELELASLGPYLETVPSDLRDQVLVELSKLYFGREMADHKVDSPVDVQKMIDTLAKVALSKVNVG